jgi:hypothetical protein
MEMLVSWIEVKRLGREPFGEIGRQFRFQETLGFLHHALGNP